MKEKQKIKIAIFIFIAIAIFGNSAIEFLGEARYFAIANFIGEIFAPFFFIGAIFLIVYFFGYYFAYIPKKIIYQLKSR